MRIIYWLKNQDNATAATVSIPEDLIDAVMKVKANATISGHVSESDKSDHSDVDVDI